MNGTTIEGSAAESPRRLRCAEVWGGIDRVDTELCTGGLDAALFSTAHRGERGGDIYYLSVCGQDMLTRIVIADVAGHGEVVARTAEALYAKLVTHLEQDDGGAILEELNRDANELGISAITTAAVLGLYTEDADLRLAYAGHPPALIRHQGETTWIPAPYEDTHEPGADVPLAVLDDARYRQQRCAMKRGDRLLVYTDGLLDAPTPGGERLGQEGLMTLLNAGPADESLVGLKRRLATALSLDEEGHATHDDVTFLAIDITSDPTHSGLSCTP